MVTPQFERFPSCHAFIFRTYKWHGAVHHVFDTSNIRYVVPGPKVAQIAPQSGGANPFFRYDLRGSTSLHADSAKRLTAAERRL